MTLPYHPKLIKPVGPPDAELMIVSRYPGQKDFQAGYALQGGSAMLLREACDEVQYELKSTFRTNVVPHFPPQGKVDRWLVPKKSIPAEYTNILGPIQKKFFDPDILPFVAELQEHIRIHQPNCILALGAEVSRILIGNDKIGQCRGAVHDCQLNPGTKVIPTYSPGACWANFALQPIFKADVHKAIRESKHPDVRTTARTIYVPESLSDLEEFWKCHGSNITTVDIETVPSRRQITDVGIATSSSVVLTIPILDRTKPGYHYWQEAEDELAVWEFIRRIVEDPNIQVRGQGYLYDATWLYDLLGIRSTNYYGDSLVIHHALYPEVSKDLGFLASLYCEEIAWKQMASFKQAKKDG